MKRNKSGERPPWRHPFCYGKRITVDESSPHHHFMFPMQSISSHPAVRLGRFLRLARMTRGIVKRLFAGQIMLSPSAYTEVEAGVVRWVQEPQRKAILV